MTRAVVSVATTPHYQKGMARLRSSTFIDGETWTWARHPEGCPAHSEVPYAFKAFAMRSAVTQYRADLLLWCDASILPIRSLEPLWERIERDGYWFSKNGWSNYEWTADSAYPDLFPDRFNAFDRYADALEDARAVNRIVPHVVATSFGLNVKHPKGKAFLDEYYRLASETKAFCGPWTNANYGIKVDRYDGVRVAPCGPPDVRGHRHDQTAASVIAWRLGMELTDPPQWFAYSKRRADGTLNLSDQDERTILLADGKMEDGVVHGLSTRSSYCI